MPDNPARLTPLNFRNGGKAQFKAFFTNLANGEEMPVQFNPTEFTKSLEVEYARQTVPGLSHKVLQYVGTTNAQFEMDLYFIADTIPQALANEKTRRFLEGLCYPRGVDSIVDGGPPRVLFVWPRFISMNMVITSMTDVYSMFGLRGQPREMTITITMEEVRQVRLLSDDAFTGMQRSERDGAGEETGIDDEGFE